MEELEAEEEDDTVFNPPTRTFSFRLGRKRRKSNSSNSSQEYDDVSLCSLSSLDSVGSLEKQSSCMNHVIAVAQKSLSLRSLNQEVFPPNGHAPHAKPDSSFVSPYKKPGPTPTKRRASRLWMDTVNGASLNLSVKEVKRQEAMFELYQGEEDMLEDLRLAKKTYRDSMQQLKLMTEEELQCVFGRLDRLLPLHEDSVKRLKQVRDSETYTIDSIGDALLAWLPSMRSPYVEYCANQVYAKSLLDAKKVDRRVQDFLQRCLESPFSRKLDLWSFLDVPRSRLVKYPILLKAILKYVKLIESIIGEVDREAGQQKCQFVINRLVESEHRIHPLIHESHYLLCAGELRNSRGTKVDVFLFEKVLVVTRKITRNSTALYQIYRSPLPVADMTVDEKEHGGLQRSSFRRSLSSLTSQGQGRGQQRSVRDRETCFYAEMH
ncbi:PREDICTED: rho guanine nucleotide exchange factor 3-like [Priapulus caudatus]|uniref:Rho guanine nucleotide exchange factor 3-like n=1 Tax=Priapulus caudatus TaxID=37621 RepID=A0ABM1EWX1_PRICU|nr:PREDICTED: rho guanine nucleotide exchange factor 3-like [Priapulus caudatus]